MTGESDSELFAHFVPERDGVCSVRGVLNDCGELVLWNTWDELGEAKAFVIREIAQCLSDNEPSYRAIRCDRRLLG